MVATQVSCSTFIICEKEVYGVNLLWLTFLVFECAINKIYLTDGIQLIFVTFV